MAKELETVTVLDVVATIGATLVPVVLLLLFLL